MTLEQRQTLARAMGWTDIVGDTGRPPGGDRPFPLPTATRFPLDAEILWTWLEGQGYIPTVRTGGSAATATLESLVYAEPLTVVVLAQPDPHRPHWPVEPDPARRRRLALVLVALKAIGGAQG